MEDFGATYQELRAMRQFAKTGMMVQEKPWLEDLHAQMPWALPLSLVLIVGLIVRTLTWMANPVADEVPRGRVPRLADWLQRRAPPRPPGNYGGRAPPRGGKPVATDVESLSLQPVASVPELWQMYSFATRQIVEEVPSMIFERNYVYSLALQAARFPTVYSDWERYESCAVEEVQLGPTGTSLAPVPQAAVPKGSVQEVVMACGTMLESYGLTVVARDTSGIVGSLTLRVKRLPEGCHVDDDGNAEPSVVCNVDAGAVTAAAGLEAVGYLESIAVDPGWRGSGLAERLLRFAESKVRAWGLGLLGLHVHRDNWAALRFYQRQGYEATSDWMGWGDGFFLLLRPL